MLILIDFHESNTVETRPTLQRKNEEDKNHSRTQESSLIIARILSSDKEGVSLALVLLVKQAE
jgi:hypothetical protein